MRFRHFIPRIVIFYLSLVFVICHTFRAVSAQLEPFLYPEQISFSFPTVEIPYYHIKLPLKLAAKDTGLSILSITVNKQPIQFWRAYVDRSIIPQNEFLAPKENLIVIRYLWLNKTKYKIIIALQNKENELKTTQKVTAKSPETGGFWDVSWKDCQTIILFERSGIPRNNELIDVCLNAPAASWQDPVKELRILKLDTLGNTQEVRSQVYDVSGWADMPAKENYMPTIRCHVLFEASVAANSDAIYLAVYGNPEAKKAEYATGLSVTGLGMERVVSNGLITVEMDKQSGQMNRITLLGEVEQVIDNKPGPVHWNPGCYAPPKHAWQHSFNWNPPADYQEITGPLMFQTTRSGYLPKMPQVHLSVTYGFYDGKPYFQSSTLLKVEHDIAVLALRNDEMVFKPHLFTHAAWLETSGKMEKAPLVQNPDMPFGTSQIIEAKAPWICFYHPDGKYGYGSIRLDYVNFREVCDNVTTWREHTYFTVPNENYVYWYRAMVYPFIWDDIANQKVIVPAGSYYYERNIYMPFRLGNSPENLFQPLQARYEIMKHPLQIKIF